MPHNNWEVWLDTQISPIIAKWMAEYTGLVVKSSYVLSLNALTDTVIYEKAKAAGKVIIISKDADFHELVSRLGSPPKLICIKKGNTDNRLLWEFLKKNINHAINILLSSDVDIVEID